MGSDRISHNGDLRDPCSCGELYCFFLPGVDRLFDASLKDRVLSLFLFSGVGCILLVHLKNFSIMSTLYDILGWDDIPLEEKCAMFHNMWSNKTGKYIGYYKSLEGSGVGFSDIIEVAKGQWCFGMVVFENAGLTTDILKEKFPDSPPQGTILSFLESSYKELYRQGVVRMKETN